jgi:aspartate/methionine/tyrosine aminotransferase
VGLSAPPPDALGAWGDAPYVPDARGLPAAREAVAAYYAARGRDVHPDDVVLTTGTSESYAHLFRLLVSPGWSVLAPAPSYPLFEPLARLEGVELEAWHLAYDGRWHADLDSIERGFRRGARAAILVEPNHPTGTMLAAEEFAAFESSARAHDAALIVDEVFGDFAWNRNAPFASRAGERATATFVLSGLSKVCGWPQLKLGWIVIQGPEAARREARRGLEWIADLFLSVGSAVQRALPVLLDARHAFHDRVRERLDANRATLEAWQRRQSEVDILRAEGGWHVVLRLPSRASGEAWSLALLARGVIVHPGHFYDIERESFVVMSLIPRPEIWSRALEAFDAVLAAP